MRSFTPKLLLFFTISTILASIHANQNNEKSRDRDDYYSSMYGVQNLAKSEQKVVAKLVRYKKKLSNTLAVINEYLDDYSTSIHSMLKRSQQLRKKFKDDKYPIFKTDKDLEVLSAETTANPLLVFKLLRRFAIDLDELQQDVNSGYQPKFSKFMNKVSLNRNLPTLDDLRGAADGLLRLQQTYQLPTPDMANGKIIEKKTGCKLQASDLLFVGVRAVNTERLATGMEWMYRAYENVLQGDDSLPKDMIKDHLMKTRTWHNDELLTFRNGPSNLFSNLVNSTFTNIPHLFIPPFITEYPLGGEDAGMYLHDSYNFDALCRGEQLLSPKDTKNLRCWYTHDISPYNILSPLKFELFHENPPVLQVYDLLSDDAIDHIKNLSLKRLSRARVVGNLLSGDRSDVRTSSVAWLLDLNTNNEFLDQIPRLVNRATGLVTWNSDSAEGFQVQCYGSVGGYYIPHFDSLYYTPVGMNVERRNDFTKRGDRVATIMFYLSDVEMGGGTAFPRMGIAAKAVKGSAVIWYNLKLNGKLDPLTIHGGCPVLFGNKWVANKWIRLLEQFNVRKCSTLESK